MKIECIKKMLLELLKDNSIKDALRKLYKEVNDTDYGFDEDIENDQSLKALDFEIKTLLIEHLAGAKKPG